MQARWTAERTPMNSIQFSIYLLTELNSHCPIAESAQIINIINISKRKMVKHVKQEKCLQMMDSLACTMTKVDNKP
jgi:hypothetical protein